MKTAIFDLDGTILDTYPGIYLSANMTLNKLSLPDADPIQFKKFIGPPLRESFKIGCGLTDPAQLDFACPDYLNNYRAEGYKHANVYPGLIELLCNLKAQGVYLAVATMKIETISLNLLRYHDIARYFDEIRGSDDSYSRTKTSNILSIMEHSGVKNKSDAIMIGDTEGDVMAARNAGIDCIKVNYGYGFCKDDSEAFPLCDLKAIIETNLKLKDF